MFPSSVEATLEHSQVPGDSADGGEPERPWGGGGEADGDGSEHRRARQVWRGVRGSMVELDFAVLLRVRGGAVFLVDGH